MTHRCWQLDYSFPQQIEIAYRDRVAPTKATQDDCPAFFESVHHGDFILVRSGGNRDVAVHYVGIADELSQWNENVFCWTLSFATDELNNELEKAIRDNAAHMPGGNEPKPLEPLGGFCLIAADGPSKEICNIMKRSEDLTGLSCKSVEDLADKDIIFDVDFYQRGYRWSPDDVEKLATDIAQYNGAYFLQPLIVRKCNAGPGNPQHYELVDGQQRITSRNLILEAIGSRFHFQLNYLRDKENRKGKLNLDEKFKQAAIQRLSACRTKPCEEQMRKVFFVLYDIGSSQNGYDIFNKINSGKIPLSDSDLIKASILQNMKNSWKEKEKEEFLSSWDTAARHLGNNEFYGFVLGAQMRGFKETHYSSRLDFLLLQLLGEQDKQDAFPLYSSFIKFIGASPYPKIRNLISELRKLDDFLLESFDDDMIYHYMGVLLSMHGNRTISSIIGNKDKEGLVRLKKESFIFDKGEFKTYLQSEISKILKKRYKLNDAEDIDKLIKSDGDSVRDVLLIHNAFIELDCGRRFSFFSFFNENWEIEHINPDTENYSDKDLLNSLYMFLCNDPNEQAQEQEKKEVLRNEYKRLMARFRKSARHDNPEKNTAQNEIEDAVILQYFKDELYTVYSGEEKQNLWNLVLLDKSTNAGNQNKFFLEKRKAIIAKAKNRAGSYVLPATAYAFMKSYSSSLANPFQWDKDDDGQQYINDIKRVLNEYVFKEEQ